MGHGAEFDLFERRQSLVALNLAAGLNAVAAMGDAAAATFRAGHDLRAIAAHAGTVTEIAAHGQASPMIRSGKACAGRPGASSGVDVLSAPLLVSLPFFRR